MDISADCFGQDQIEDGHEITIVTVVTDPGETR